MTQKSNNWLTEYLLNLSNERLLEICVILYDNIKDIKELEELDVSIFKIIKERMKSEYEDSYFVNIKENTIEKIIEYPIPRRFNIDYIIIKNEYFNLGIHNNYFFIDTFNNSALRVLGSWDTLIVPKLRKNKISAIIKSI